MITSNPNYIKYINKYIEKSITANRDLCLTNPEYYEYNGTFLNAKYNCNYNRVLISPLSIRFSQSNIHYFFDKSRSFELKKHNKETMFENTVFRTLKYLRDNLQYYHIFKQTKKQTIAKITLPFLPINVLKVYLDKEKTKYVFVSLDNRRLYTLQYIARLYYPEYLLLAEVNILELDYQQLQESNLSKFSNNYGVQAINITSNKYESEKVKGKEKNDKDRKLIDTWCWYEPFKKAKYND